MTKSWRYFCLMFCGLAFVACSSKPTAQEVGETSSLPETPAQEIETPTPPTKNEPKRVEKIEPSNYQGLSEAIRSQNDEAIYRSATRLLSQNPNDAKVQNALGLYHYKKGRFQAAQYFFSKALKTTPNAADLHNNLGLSLLAQDEKREAIVSLKRAVELDPTNASAAINLSSIYLAEKDYQKALVPLEMTVRKGTKDFRLLNNYGVALAGTGKYTQAKGQYQAALSVNSSAKDVMLNLAILYIDQLKSYQEGMDLLSKVKFLGPPEGSRNRITALENKARAGAK
jgi:Tfp pilus assembly protein PilF